MKQKIKQIYTKKDAKQVNKLAREQLKLRLLADIAMDIQICKIEEWDYKEYIIELQNLLKWLLKNENI